MTFKAEIVILTALISTKQGSDRRTARRRSRFCPPDTGMLFMTMTTVARNISGRNTVAINAIRTVAMGRVGIIAGQC